MADKLIRNPQMITSQIDGEVFMMDIDQDSFLGLNEVASFIWDLLEKPHAPGEVIAAVKTAFEAPDEGAIERDVTAFLDSMLKDKLVMPANG